MRTGLTKDEDLKFFATILFYSATKNKNIHNIVERMLDKDPKLTKEFLAEELEKTILLLTYATENKKYQKAFIDFSDKSISSMEELFYYYLKLVELADKYNIGVKLLPLTKEHYLKEENINLKGYPQFINENTHLFKRFNLKIEGKLVDENPIPAAEFFFYRKFMYRLRHNPEIISSTKKILASNKKGSEFYLRVEQENIEKHLNDLNSSESKIKSLLNYQGFLNKNYKEFMD